MLLSEDFAQKSDDGIAERAIDGDDAATEVCRRPITVAERQKHEDDRDGNRDPDQPPLHLREVLLSVLREDVFGRMEWHRISIADRRGKRNRPKNAKQAVCMIKS